MRLAIRHELAVRSQADYLTDSTIMRIMLAAGSAVNKDSFYY